MDTFVEVDIQKKLRKFVKNNFYHASHMQISPRQANYICSLLNNNNCKNILEIGTLYGYSALSFAINSPNDVKITCIEKDKSSLKVAEQFWLEAKVSHKIKIINGNAMNILNSIKEKYDLIFIDADKKNYINYFEKSLPLLNQTGILVFDNVLWKGLVAQKMNNDRVTTAIRRFNDYIKNDKRITTRIVSIGDGLAICKKITKF